jgi:hypothetical protein
MRARESEEDMRKKCVLDTDTKFVFVFFGTFSAKKFESHKKRGRRSFKVELNWLTTVSLASLFFLPRAAVRKKKLLFYSIDIDTE